MDTGGLKPNFFSHTSLRTKKNGNNCNFIQKFNLVATIKAQNIISWVLKISGF